MMHCKAFLLDLSGSLQGWLYQLVTANVALCLASSSVVLACLFIALLASLFLPRPCFAQERAVQRSDLSIRSTRRNTPSGLIWRQTSRQVWTFNVALGERKQRFFGRPPQLRFFSSPGGVKAGQNFVARMQVSLEPGHRTCATF